MRPRSAHDGPPRRDSPAERAVNSEFMRPIAKSRRRTQVRTILIVLAVVGACGFGMWEWLAWKESLAARRALAAGRFQEAQDAVGRLLKLRLRRAEAHYLQAKTAIALGHRGEYLNSLKQAAALGYDRDRLAVLRALIDAQFGRVAEAQPVLARAFADAANGTPDLMVDEVLARVYLERYDFPHASAVLSQWAKDAPDDPRPPWWRAALNRRRDAEPDVIIADYLEMLRRAPGHVDALRGIAEQLDRAHRDSAAAEAYTELLTLHPDDTMGQLGAGRNALILGDETAAVSHLDRVLALAPDNASAHIELAKINLQKNQASAALEHLDRVVALTPFNRDAHYQRSLALKRLGRHDESAIEQAIFARLGHDQQEREDLEERLAASPDDPHLQSQLARWMLAHGYDQEGINWAKKILIEHPDQPEICLVLAEYYKRVGDWELAQSYTNRASHRRP
jgi:tetratricopeptide (TPR) repeat protein